MKYYPINLNISGKNCVVIGGGKVAERKVLSLLDCEAKVTVISPKVTRRIKLLADNSKIRLLKRSYKNGDLKKAFLSIAATDDKDMNFRIACEADKNKVILNIVDSPQLCDFIIPSVIRRGDLAITVSTSGKAPALSKNLRIMLEDIIGDEYELILDKLAEFRDKLKTKSLSQKKRKELIEKFIASGNKHFLA